VNNAIENQIRQLARGSSVSSSIALVDELTRLGLDFQIVEGFAHLTKKVELLDDARISSQTHSEFALNLQWSIDSTNDHLMKSGIAADSVGICMAEQQNAGKGRRGKVWVSPFGQNIYLSLGRHFTGAAAGLMGLSLVIGVCVVRTLRNLGIESVGLKWPNDIILDSGKLAGILVEVGKSSRESTFVVMGIGINLELGDEDARQIDQPFSTIGQRSEVSRNDLASKLIDSLIPALLKFEKEGFVPFHEEWNSFNVYREEEVVILRGDDRIHGTDAGVDQGGRYLLKTSKGTESFNAGEVSLRLRNSS
jgi:BirA family biotin operon repressor/biotin-[acetyl-CoA-carboxylase] ligase